MKLLPTPVKGTFNTFENSFDEQTVLLVSLNGAFF